VTEINIGG